MSTASWTVAPTGYLDSRGLGVRPFDGGGAGRIVPPLAPARRSGLPEARIGIQLGTANLFGTHTTATIARFNVTTLGIPSSRRPLS